MNSKSSVKNESKKLTIITIAIVMILVIIFAGVTYAFFTANNPEGSTAQIISETGRMVINYDDGTDIIQPVTGIVPSNAIIVNKTFTLTGSNTTVGMSEGDGLPMPYKVGVKYTSTFSDGMMHYYIKEVNRPTNSNVTANYVIKPETGKIEDDYKNQIVPGNDTYTGYTHGTFKNGKKYTEMVTGEFPASLNDQNITFNLIIQFPDNNENQDSEKGKTFNGKVVVNYEAPKSFAEDTWETIAENTSSDVYNVGDTRQVLIDNKTYTVRIANKSTPVECNDSNFSQTACGFVVEFVDIIENRTMNSTKTNVGGWPTTAMRTYLNGDTKDHLTYNDSTNGTTATLFSKLPKELRDVIIDTTVVSGHGQTSGEENFNTTDQLYLLSGKEIWGNCTQSTCYDTATDVTRQLDYYADNHVTTSENRSYAIKKNINGKDPRWWLRGAISITSYSFLIVNHNGSWTDAFANDAIGLAPAFRIG